MWFKISKVKDKTSHISVLDWKLLDILFKWWVLFLLDHTNGTQIDMYMEDTYLKIIICNGKTLITQILTLERNISLARGTSILSCFLCVKSFINMGPKSIKFPSWHPNCQNDFWGQKSKCYSEFYQYYRNNFYRITK